MISKKTICLGITILTAVILKLIYPSLTSEDLKFILHPVSEVMSEPGSYSFSGNKTVCYHFISHVSQPNYNYGNCHTSTHQSV